MWMGKRVVRGYFCNFVTLLPDGGGGTGFLNNVQLTAWIMKERDMTGIKNIIFDLGGVLINLERQRCIEAFEQVGMDKVVHYVKEGKVQDLFYDSEIGNTNTQKFCDEVRYLTQSNIANDDIVWAWNQLLGEISDEKKECLLLLKKKYRLFLLSNTNEMHWNHCLEKKLNDKGLGVNDYFERVFLSYEMHQLKPSASIFEQVLQEAHLKAEETLFVDDSLANCEGARSVGIKAWHEKTGEEWMEKIISSDPLLSLL